MWPRLVNVRVGILAQRHRDVGAVEADEELVCTPDLGEDFDESWLLPASGRSGADESMVRLRLRRTTYLMLTMGGIHATPYLL
jgi:hypothetical protein